MGTKKSRPSNAKPGRKDISEIAKFKPILGDKMGEKVELVRKYIDSKGVSRVAGTKALKGSQNYPLPFLFHNLVPRLLVPNWELNCHKKVTRAPRFHGKKILVNLNRVCSLDMPLLSFRNMLLLF